jgi:ribosomal subunit interface protein
MDIIFKGRQTDVPERFRQHATAKLNKFERLDQKAIRVDVEVSVERNPRQSSHKERVELTIRSRGPAIRAEASAEDRFAALDLALGKLDSRLRRALDRRKGRHAGHAAERREPAPANVVPAEGMVPGQLGASEAPGAPGAPGALAQDRPGAAAERAAAERAAAERAAAERAEPVVPIAMQGKGPLVVRQKFHRSEPITIDQALLEMELVGHDFYLYYDADEGLPSVVYRRRGYQYGVIRLVGNSAARYATDLAGAGRKAAS